MYGVCSTADIVKFRRQCREGMRDNLLLGRREKIVRDTAYSAAENSLKIRNSMLGNSP